MVRKTLWGEIRQLVERQRWGDRHSVKNAPEAFALFCTKCELKIRYSVRQSYSRDPPRA